MRLGTYILFGLGAFIMFPIYTYSYLYPTETRSEREEPVKWYMLPLILAGCTLPAVLATFTFAPWVHQIHVRIPTVARRSKEDLLRWANNVPRHTTLSFSVIRNRPWPIVQYASFEDLQRLPLSRTRLTNLEHIPPEHEMYVAENQRSWRARLLEGMARRIYGRFYVNIGQKTNKSAVPGVWDKMWKQIPMEGQKVERQKMLEHKRAETKAPSPRILPGKERPKSKY